MSAALFLCVAQRDSCGLNGEDIFEQPYFQIQHSKNIGALNVSIDQLNEQFYKEVSAPLGCCLSRRWSVNKKNNFSEHKKRRATQLAARCEPPASRSGVWPKSGHRRFARDHREPEKSPNGESRIHLEPLRIRECGENYRMALAWVHAKSNTTTVRFGSDVKRVSALPFGGRDVVM